MCDVTTTGPAAAGRCRFCGSPEHEPLTDERRWDCPITIVLDAAGAGEFRLPWHDPTYGRIDRDVQEQVDAMKPSSLGQRVAIENTLQERRDRSQGRRTRR